MQTLLDKIKDWWGKAKILANKWGKKALTLTAGTALAASGGAVADQQIDPYMELETDVQRAVLVEERGEVQQSFDVRTDRPEFTMRKGEKEGLMMSYDLQASSSRSTFSKKLQYQRGNQTVEIFPHQSTSSQGVKMNVVLQSQPATSTFSFDIPNFDEFEFEKRGERLIANPIDEIQENALLVGENIYVIERPLIYDDAGNEVYGELVYKNGQVQVVVPEKFLANAVYPVVVDPFATLSVGSQDYNSDGIDFNSDGTKMFIAGNTNDNIYEYELLTAYDITTATFSTSTDISSETTDPGGLDFNSDGTKVILGSGGDNEVIEYNLSSGFDITTLSFNASTSISEVPFLSTARVTSDGDKFYTTDAGSANGIYEYDFGTSYDVTTLSFVASTTVVSQNSSPSAVSFNSDGTKMFVLDDDDKDVDEYNLSTAYDITTKSYVDSYDLGLTQDEQTMSMVFHPDGYKWFLGTDRGFSGTVESYLACSPFDLSETSEEGCPPYIVTNSITNISDTSADGNGDIKFDYGTSTDERGFVYDTSSHATPTPDTTDLGTTTDSFEGVSNGSTDLSSTNIWKQASVSTDDGDWQGETSGTPSSGTGPSGPQSGSVYIYTEASSGDSCDSTGSPSNVCIVEADITDDVNGTVDYYYHMDGADQGTFSLDAYDGSSWTELWSVSGDQGTSWINNSVSWSASDGYTRLRFHKHDDATGFEADIALDNIKVHEESVSENSPANSDYPSVENETGTFGTGTFSLNLSGLSSDTQYFVRAYAENSEGFSYGDEVNFTTNAAGGGVIPQSIYTF